MIVSSIKDNQNFDDSVQTLSQVKQDLAVLTDESTDNQVNLRPSRIQDYIGQEQLVRQLDLILQSSKIRGRMPEHILFYGQPGLGKTTLASLIAGELNGHFKMIAAPSLQKIGDIVSVLVGLEPNTVLFIDEIHRLKAPLEETLYSALEDGKVDLMIGKGQGATVTRLDISPFVLVGATTQFGKLSKPLRDRFANTFQLEPYTDNEILDLIERNVSILKIKLDDDAKLLICRRSRGVPRIANNIMKRFVDLQTVHKIKMINKLQAEEFLQELGVFDKGLTKSDLGYLRSLLPGSLGLKTLSGVLLEEVETLEQVTEPFLIHLGFIDKDSSGRRLTLKGREFISHFDGNGNHVF